MADEKILDNEIMSDEELDGVAGGTYAETFGDMDYVTKHTGIRFHGSDSDKREQLRDLLWNAGIKLKDHGGFDSNEYYRVNTQTGEKLGRLNREDAMYEAVMEIRRQRGMY